MSLTRTLSDTRHCNTSSCSSSDRRFRSCSIAATINPERLRIRCHAEMSRIAQMTWPAPRGGVPGTQADLDGELGAVPAHRVQLESGTHRSAPRPSDIVRPVFEVRSPLAGRNKPLDQSTRQRFAAPPEHPHRLLIDIEDETLGIHNQRGVRRSLEHRPVVVVVGKQAAPLAVQAAHGTKSRERQNNRRLRRAHVGGCRSVGDLPRCPALDRRKDENPGT